MSEDKEQIEGTLEVCSDGIFRARLSGCDKRTWCGMTSRSAKVRMARAVGAERGHSAGVAWSYKFPSDVAGELAEFKRRHAEGAVGFVVRAERVRLAERLIRGCRLTMAESARVLGVSPSLLSREM